jgi:hypothetical protein
MSARLKPIGGEMAFLAGGDLHTYLTDTGRSSLRLILRSGFADRRFLLPDFLCGVVPRVVREAGARYAYYRTGPGLSIDADSVRHQAFDVLYVIDYFGARQQYRSLVGADQWVIEDAVFLPWIEPPDGVANWIGFTSFRKISPLADGSLVRSTIPLAGELLERTPAPFAAAKYQAKRTKHEFLQEGRYSEKGEEQYLAQFAAAEDMADRQAGIYPISGESLFNLLAFHRDLAGEYGIRARNFRFLEERLGRLGVPLEPEYPCLYVLDVGRRDELREYLRARRIFLPVHWPRPEALENPLYDRIISIPVDSRYGEEDLQRVVAAIEEFAAG